jgi:hypothetical protein
MARKPKKLIRALNEEPGWPTGIRYRTRDGRVAGTDGSVWQLASVPMGPSKDAKTDEARWNLAVPLMAAFGELGTMANPVANRRNLSQGSYRKFQLVSVSTPAYFSADRDAALRSQLNTWYGKKVVKRRACVLAVQLRDQIGDGTLRGALDSISYTLSGEGAPMSDFDRDSQKVRTAFSRSGLTEVSEEDSRLVEAWWNHGQHADTPFLPHADHLHVFPTADAMDAALRVDPTDCSDWPDIPGQYSISFASVGGLDLDMSAQLTAVDDEAEWIGDLLDRDALCVSVRGFVEPGTITRTELRTNRRKFASDIQERASQGAMDRVEENEQLANLEMMEKVYARKHAPNTLTKVSTVVGFSGKIEDMSRAGGQSLAQLNSMLGRQPRAMAETWLASQHRANPTLLEIPSTVLAAAGANGLSTVGDPDGALVGFTEKDQQPAFLSPEAASNSDGLPMGLVAGATGSGKAVKLSTTIPTPSGWTTMGELKVGDLVLGRNGKPTRVTYLSPVDENPDLYRLTFSDGQEILADYDHQWVVSDHMDRNRFKSGKRQTALAAWKAAHEDVALLRAAAEATSPESEATLTEVTAAIDSVPLSKKRWNSEEAVYSALHMMEVPSRTEVRTLPYTYAKKVVTKTDPARVFDLDAALDVLIEQWSNVTGANQKRWGAQIAKRKAAAIAAKAALDTPREVTSSELVDVLEAHGSGPMPKKSWRSRLLETMKNSGIEVRWGEAVVTMERNKAEYTTRQKVSLYNTRLVLQRMALRLEEQYAVAPRDAFEEKRMTTGEILAASAGKTQKHAIRITAPLDLPEVDLPVAPYAFGAWLGDGFSGIAQIVSDDPQIIDEIAACGYTPEWKRLSNAAQSETTFIYGLGDRFRDGLKKLGLNHRKTKGVRTVPPKHIPIAYLRASIDQRLALLQGLMDTDGTIDTNGSCELTLSDERLADDALELIRSLGIKASRNISSAGYRNADGEYVPCKDRHRIHFTTTQRVFRLKRKADRLPETVRDSDQWLYIDSIEKVAPEPARCLTVEDPDATYLTGGFIPTSNTQLLLWLSYQVAQMNRPQVIIDPKVGSDLSEPVQAAGGQVASLDDLISADGIFDPLRFAETPEAAVDMATSLLMSINPWGTKKSDYETPLSRAIHLGVQQGATCIGQALEAARGHERVPDEMIDRVFDLAGSSPTFAACVGRDPNTQPLRVASGVTLIKVGGAHLDLPEAGHEPDSITQRIALGLVRMMVFGSATALTGRRGVLHLDEAWTFLGAGASEVNRLGRLARSQQVLPLLYTQRVSDAVDAGLTGYISRGLDATDERMARITGRATRSAAGSDSGAPNFNSFKPLRDGPGGKVIRGSVALYSDLSGERAVPVVVDIPDWFFKMSSTNPLDRERARREAGLNSA